MPAPTPAQRRMKTPGKRSFIRWSRLEQHAAIGGLRRETIEAEVRAVAFGLSGLLNPGRDCRRILSWTATTSCTVRMCRGFPFFRRRESSKRKPTDERVAEALHIMEGNRSEERRVGHRGWTA